MTSNPYTTGTAAAEEWAAIVARLTTDRRAVHATEDRIASAAALMLNTAEHAARLEQLATAGVLFGPDCSQFQGAVNWSAVVAAGCRILGYKVSEGRTYADPQHQRNRAATGALQAAGKGVPLAYHYLFDGADYRANPALWEAQADWYCSLVDPAAIHALDVEDSSPAPGLGVGRWIRGYRRHYPTKPLFIYSNRGMWVNRSHVTGGWPADVLPWHAGISDGRYTPATGSIPAEYAATGSLSNSLAALGAPAARMWQITDHGAVPGIVGTCDGNAFLGTFTELQAYATGASDDMSAADVDAITKDLHAYIDGKVDDIAAAAASALLGRNLGSSGPNVAVALQSGFQLAQKIQAQTDTLEASAAAAAATDAAVQAGVDTLNAKLGSGAGGTLTKADLLEALGAVRLTTDPQQPTT